MSNITQPRDAIRTGGENFTDPVAAATKLIKGAMYGLNSSGYAVNMETGVAAVARGEVVETVDNSDGDDGDVSVNGRSGVFRLHILGSSALVAADAYNFPPVYAQDNHTVAKSSDTGARPVMGRLIAVRGGYAEVAVGPMNSVALPDGDLVAANNLSDVASAATARANLGANKGELFVTIPSLVGTGVTRVPLPDRAVTITRIKSVIDAALADGDATLTAKINTTAITTGVITIAESGSAAGDQDECSPSALNVSDGADDYLSFTVGGTNTADIPCQVCVEYTW